MNHRQLLKTFLERGYITKGDRMLLLLSSSYGFTIAKRIFPSMDETIRNDATVSCQVKAEIPVYRGDHETAHAIIQQLEAAHHPALYCALVHGSIASSEETAYSDFDGILVIDESKIEHPSSLFSLRKLIHKTEQLFYKTDALQHHGWQVLLKSELNQYPDHLLPFALFQSGRMLYPYRAFTIDALVSLTPADYRIPLKQTCRSILRKCISESALRDHYALKNFLSEVLLLPALFIQAQRGSSILKKESFRLLKTDYPTLDSSLMDQVSQIRLNWQQEKFSTSLEYFHRLRSAGLYVHALAPDIPVMIKMQVNRDFLNSTEKFCLDLLKRAGLDE
ncbi:MAG: hypothetical protein JNL88_12250 [Bacteroidia bacterium]|nr:hypothetical protein [Bacteroidia bacterium]